MRFDLVIDGRTHSVDLGTGKVITVEVDGRVFRAEVSRTRKGLTVLVDDRESHVRFGGSRVSVDGDEHRVEVRNLRRGMPFWSTTGQDPADGGAGRTPQKITGVEGAIHPPMPGRVVSIKVKEGDSVGVGSPVLVLEAMKMQNEIASHMDGKVKEIRVSEGDLVEASDILVVIGS